MITVAGIFVYPIKSCGGVALARAELDRLGLVGDRRLVVVDPQDEFITQREEPRLSLVEVSFLSGSLRAGHVAEQLRMRSSVGELALGPANGPRKRVKVWEDPCDALVHPEGSAFLSAHLDRPCELVEIAPDAYRPAPAKYALPSDRVGFADAFPLLAISEASLEDLNRRLASPVPMDRFRPNLVIAGAAPFEEDQLGSFTVGEIGMRAVKPCSRCVITTVDQKTGRGGREPLRTLATYRKIGSKVMFGQNVLHDGPGTIRIGDPVVRRMP